MDPIATEADCTAWLAWLEQADPRFVEGIANGAEGQGAWAEALWLIRAFAGDNGDSDARAAFLRALACRWLARHAPAEDED